MKMEDDEALERLFEQMSPEAQKEMDNQHTPRLITELAYNNFVFLAADLTELKIEFKCNHYEVYYKTGYCPEKIPEPFVLNATDTDTLGVFLNELNIRRWKAKYIEENILDGEDWTVNVKFFDGTKRKIRGSNHYPSKWPKFKAMLKWIAEKQAEYL